MKFIAADSNNKKRTSYTLIIIESLLNQILLEMSQNLLEKLIFLAIACYVVERNTIEDSLGKRPKFIFDSCFDSHTLFMECVKELT